MGSGKNPPTRVRTFPHFHYKSPVPLDFFAWYRRIFPGVAGRSYVLFVFSRGRGVFPAAHLVGVNKVNDVNRVNSGQFVFLTLLFMSRLEPTRG